MTWRTVIHHRWRYFDETRGKWISTRYTTDERILLEHPDATPIPGTAVERLVSDDPSDWMHTNAFLRRPN